MTGPLRLTAPGGPLLLPWCGSAEALLEEVAGGATLGCLQGARMRTRAGLMAEWCAATPFPSHFGGTWDALRDALSDLPEGGTFLLLEAEQLLQDAPPAEFETLLAVLRTVQEDLRPRPFRLVLQADPDRYPTLVQGLRGLGVL